MTTMLRSDLNTNVPAQAELIGLTDLSSGAAVQFANGGTSFSLNPVITFNANVGEVFRLIDNGMPVGSIVVTSTPMSWTLPNLPVGLNAFSLVGVNSQGAQGAPVNFSIKVDATATHLDQPAADAPVAPVILGVEDHLGNIAAHGNVSADASPVVTFLATPGDVVKLFDNGMMVGTMIATTATVTWTLPAVADGAHHFSLMLVNNAGLTASTSFDLTVHAGTVGPIEPVVPVAPVFPATPVILELADHLGDVSNHGNKSVDANPVLTFTAGAIGDTYTLMDNGHVIGTIVATSTTMEWALPALSTGDHSLALIATSANGALGRGAFVNVTVTGSDTPDHPVDPVQPVDPVVPVDPVQPVQPIVPAKPTVISVADHTGLIAAHGNASFDASPVVTFAATVGQTFIMFDNGAIVGSVVATSETMSWTLPALADGMHHLAFAEINAAGMAGPGALVDVLVDTHAAPIQPVDPVTPVTPVDPVTPVVDPTHTTIGLHDTFVGTTGDQVIDLAGSVNAYFSQSTAHIEGGVHGIDTLHLMGSYETFSLAMVAGKTAEAKLSGVEAFDLGGHSNTLNVTAGDVLNLGEQDLFRQDGKQQVLVKGEAGDTLNLSSAHVAGVADGHWDFNGLADVGGVSYAVFEHSGAHVEILAQETLRITVH